VTLNYRELDWKLISAVLLLSLIGIMLIMSAQHYADSDFERTYFLRQLIWLAIALMVFAVVIHLPQRLFDFSAYLFYAVSLGLLVLVATGFETTPRSFGHPDFDTGSADFEAA
jgi:cell division protein FtsW (lipid II flippase)